jgi:hypothetical protein
MAFTCPRCGATSHHPMDAHEGYCAACQDWTGGRSWSYPRWFYPRYFSREGRPMTLREWSLIVEEDLAYKHVRMSMVGDVQVSTVWIGLPQAGSTPERPLIFESMVFGGPLDEHAWRWSTLEEAEAGHELVLAKVREAQERAGLQEDQDGATDGHPPAHT